MIMGIGTSVMTYPPMSVHPAWEVFDPLSRISPSNREQRFRVMWAIFSRLSLAHDE